MLWSKAQLCPALLPGNLQPELSLPHPFIWMSFVLDPTTLSNSRLKNAWTIGTATPESRQKAVAQNGSAHDAVQCLSENHFDMDVVVQTANIVSGWLVGLQDQITGTLQACMQINVMKECQGIQPA